MSMNNTTIIFLAAWLSAASIIATGDACTGVRSMSVDDACAAASTGPVAFDLCKRTLLSSPPNYGEVTTYAIRAAAAAARSCGSAMDAGEEMLRDRSVTGDLRKDCASCMDSLRAARRAIEDVGNQLSRCAFTGLRQGYMNALSAIGACNVDGPISDTILLYGSVVGNRDRTLIAFRLGRLLEQ